MNKSEKIGIIAIPIVILAVLVSSVSSLQNSNPTSVENMSDVLLANNDFDLEIPLVSPIIGSSDASVTIFALMTINANFVNFGMKMNT